MWCSDADDGLDSRANTSKIVGDKKASIQTAHTVRQDMDGISPSVFRFGNVDTAGKIYESRVGPYRIEAGGNHEINQLVGT